MPPAVIPVTIPDVPTVATDVLLLLHIPALTTSLSVILPPGHTDDDPAIVPGFGNGFTVTVAVTVDVPQALVTA